MIAKGTFEVTVNQEPPYDVEDGVSLGRASVDKRFTSGPLEGTSVVRMIGARTKVDGSAGYVAIERIRGTLDGKRGTFVAQHSGTMKAGAFSLLIGIVPDSGTAELSGISGTMKITIENKQHFYEIEYQLPT
jgi:hypothetical protein